jgi:hypothetical protein
VTNYYFLKRRDNNPAKSFLLAARVALQQIVAPEIRGC